MSGGWSDNGRKHPFALGLRPRYISAMTSPPAATPDAVPGNWVNRAPAFAQPYLRLMRADRPVGTWLLLIPCYWGLAMAAAAGYAGAHLLWFAVLMSIGAYVMRGAGCAYNDIVDRDFDAKVARTAARPIPSGQISVKQAWAFLVFLSFIGLAFPATRIGPGVA